MLKECLIGGGVGAALVVMGSVAAQEGAGEREDSPRGGGSRWVRAGQAEIVRIEHEVADLNAIVEAQKALIEFRRTGGDQKARLDARLCLESALRPLCVNLQETFGARGVW